jgi:pimeloyl-ACP methyl ester carboxylesterase
MTRRILPQQALQQNGEPAVVKASSKPSRPTLTVRTRRAYFDCRFGQLHVRTAFPTSGGFDEQVTLFCLHPLDASSRTFSRFLPEVADVRPVYAPDLPGYGESDPSPSRGIAEAAIAISDLANDLRLRQIDVLGIQFGAEVAMELAAARPELVRRLVLAGVTAAQRLALIKQPRLIVDIAVRDDDLFEPASQVFAKQIGPFLLTAP